MMQIDTPLRRSAKHGNRNGNRWALSVPALVVVIALVLVLLILWFVRGGLGPGGGAQFASEEALLSSIGVDGSLPTSQSGQGVPGSPENGPVDSTAGAFEENREDTQVLVIYVSGRVRQPGVISLSPGARVIDALDLVGGPTEDAELEGTNLARLVADGEQIHIPAIGEEPPAAVGRGAGTNPGPFTSRCVDVNAATAADLEALPGIGPALSVRIVEYREANGSFQVNEDLQQVTGIGPKVYAGLEADLCAPG